MIFPNEKKKDLWRYASRNNPGVRDGVSSVAGDPPPRPPPPPPRLRPHHPHQSFGYSGEEDSLAMRQTPPPPYSSMPCAMDCSGSYCQSMSPNHNNNNNHSYRHLPNRLEFPPSPSCGSVLAGESSDLYCIGPGYSCASSGEDMLIEESDQERSRVTAREPDQVERLPHPRTNAATLVTILRNCCGGATESINGDDSISTIPATAKTLQHAQSRTQSQAHSQLQSTRRFREDFDGLMKLLKRKQVAELLQAVKSRVDGPTKTPQASATTPPTYLQCILLPHPTAREQHVTASRLFFWRDLRSGEELKRLPSCPSAGDPVYTCCNPLHWFRILCLSETDSHRSKMLRLKDADSEEDSQNDAKSTALSTWSSPSISSISKRAEQPSLFESFTTDGKDRNINANGWCQIAYWEMSDRVGKMFHARTTAVNIYTDGLVDSGGDSMCLSDLPVGGKTEEVQKTRQKVGLGVTLSLELGDVWIYNRGHVPIFVGSPTLERVSKVLPGCCLKAFETHRAQMLSMRQQGHHQMGPIDWFSLKISFAKGWGQFYRRQDIMCCPCWLDVNFSHLR
ncbi:mothers against decapentaplegic homolog 6 [Drosophila bipectinata]|uniref:mothers against decapentaplegic homolog 6 n=1 Tax=Drosophila bipectinata TaxID=42026 RepID=UPI001C896E2F|nr:mothers against decapentaplegic homolog 6 [Drosophila bipectinata]